MSSFPFAEKKKGSCGKIDINNNVEIPFIHETIGAVREHDGFEHPQFGKLFIYANTKGLEGIKKEDGTVVLEFNYKRIKDFELFIAVEKRRNKVLFLCFNSILGLVK